MEESHTLVAGAHRAIRRLDAPESPVGGVLVTDGEARAVLVPVADVPAACWRFSGAEHVAAVRDLVRTNDGHGALLPWCVERVDVFLGRRTAASRPLSTGEIVTLVGSLLRGVGEIGTEDVRGRWWLAADARPLFVPVAGGADGISCVVDARGLIMAVAEGCADRAARRLLTTILDAPDDARAIRRALPEWERTLTELAAPQPLQVEMLAPEPVAAIPLHRAQQAQLAADWGAPLGRRECLAAWTTARLSSVTERIGAWRERLRPRRTAEKPAPAPRRVKDVRERKEQGAPGKARKFALAAAVAGVVLVGGLVWPTDEPESSAAGAVPKPTTPAAVPSVAPSPPDESTTPPASAPPAGLEHEATVLQGHVAGCAERGDRACAVAVVSGAGPTVVERLEGMGDATPSLIEDYGDVAVLRLTGAEDTRMLVLERQKDRWLVRDVYDIADQPSDAG